MKVLVQNKIPLLLVLASLLLSVVLLNVRYVNAERIRSQKAKQLLEYNQQSGSYSLHTEGLQEIFDQTQPVVVISVVGDSRFGKSTNLNFIHHFWNGEQLKLIEKVFATNDSTEPCTHGVWVSAIPQKQGSVLLLDVQGTDLGDDRVNEELSMFTALMSSGMVLFVKGTLVHHQLSFLYRIARLSELVFGEETALSQFPQLGIIVREPLRPTEGRSLHETIVDKVTNPTHGDHRDDERRFLASYLKGREIKVSNLPHATNELLNNFSLLSKSPYKHSIEAIIEQFKSFPSKKRKDGGEADGKYLVELAKTLLKTMNGNSWLELPNAYTILEKEVCQRSFDSAVKPLLSTGLSNIEDNHKAAMALVSKTCSLKLEIEKFERQIEGVLTHKRDTIKTQTALKKEETKRVNAEKELQKTQVVHAQEIAGKDQQIQNEENKRRELEAAVQDYQKKQHVVKNEVDSLKREIRHLKTEKRGSSNGVCFSLNLPWFSIRGRKEF